ncbi:hypothetical protein [Streptomyces corynorhini]|uniref:Uncharacterized protein n=1 Tax=Streptomyces corynorhini TaxID=2282652 RepID=A0A370B4H0_9ACTN|nr:hypothetical protein [Streptomyces corynorhini]RDG36710.1 hypothetical protein DVH02_18595 [Streptomyces corynorhini]
MTRATRVREWFRGKVASLDMWWGLYGQFSAPVLLLSPRRRRVAREYTARPTDHDDVLRLLQNIRERVALRRQYDATIAQLGKLRQEMVAAELRVLDDGVLFERVFRRPQERQPEE